MKKHNIELLDIWTCREADYNLKKKHTLVCLFAGKPMYTMDKMYIAISRV